MSYTCILMALCECACANLIWKANFNLINRTDLFICLHIMFQISFQNSKGQKSYCKFLGVRSELLLSIYALVSKYGDCIRFRSHWYLGSYRVYIKYFLTKTKRAHALTCF